MLYTRSGKRSSSIIGQTRRPRRHGLTHTLHFLCFSLKIECENLQKKRPKMQKVRPPNLTVFCTVSLSAPIQSFCIVYRMLGLMQTHGVRVSKCITNASTVYRRDVCPPCILFRHRKTASHRSLWLPISKAVEEKRRPGAMVGWIQLWTTRDALTEQSR